MSKKAKVFPGRGWSRLKIRGPRDFYGGLALIVLAILAYCTLSGLPGRDGFAFGPGTAPRMFATLLAVIGGLVAVNGILFDGPAVEPFAFRGPAFVLAAIFTFAVMIQGIDFTLGGIAVRMPPLGLVASSFSAFMISILGSKEMRWLESLAAALAMTAFCVGVFVYLLQLPFQLWPWY